MHIMLVNDDGIRAPGIWALYDEFAGEHKVTVCAPHDQCSGFSHSITTREAVHVQKFERGGAEAFEIFGTPADCALVGLSVLVKDVDLVISGINDGYNAACDVHYSGTMGAACEACMQGIPALAVSTKGGNYDYTATLRCVRKVLDIMKEQPVKGCFYSLNVPRGDVTGIQCAPLGGKEYQIKYEKTFSGDGAEAYKTVVVNDRPYTPGCDRDILSQGIAAYTVINTDWTYRNV